MRQAELKVLLEKELIANNPLVVKRMRIDSDMLAFLIKTAVFKKISLAGKTETVSFPHIPNQKYLTVCSENAAFSSNDKGNNTETETSKGEKINRSTEPPAATETDETAQSPRSETFEPPVPDTRVDKSKSNDSFEKSEGC